jgi:hypothetical protein
MPTTVLRTRDGQLDASDRKAFDDLKARLQAGPAKVLIHLHGGLVSQKSGEAIAAALSGTGDHSYQAPADYEQVYVVWRTGAFETIRTNWKDLFENDRLYRALLKRLIGYVSSKVAVADGSGRSVGLAAGLSPAEIERRMRSGGDAPFADLDEAAGEPDGRATVGGEITDTQVRGEFGVLLQQSPDFTGAVEDIAAAVSWDTEGRSLVTDHGDPVQGRQSLARMRADVRLKLETAPEADDGRGLLASAALLKKLVGHGIAIAVRVIRRLRQGRGHGVHATIVEELLRELYGDLVGSAIWGMIKKDAYDHFADGKLGAELVDALSGGDHSLVVVGHSAGSIWASALLTRAAGAKGFPDFALLLLAPAVRMNEFADAVANGRHLLRTFRIFAMSDPLERVDAVLGHGTGAIYPASLLYLVSGLFELTDGVAAPDAPLLGMQRFLGRAPEWLPQGDERDAVTAVQTYIGAVANFAVWAKASGGAGLSSGSTSHGGFDDDVTTLASVHSFL